jgi:hypothetical protein
MTNSSCPICHQAFAGPAYLVDGAMKHGRRWIRRTLLICPSCFTKPPAEREARTARWHQLHGERPPTPCAHCGRLVIRGADPRLKAVTCSSSCLTALTRTSDGNSGSGQACEACGTLVTSGRSDTRYCGAPCRQRAYRQRKGQNCNA